MPGDKYARTIAMFEDCMSGYSITSRDARVSTNVPHLGATSAARGYDSIPNTERFRVAIRRGAAGDA